MKLLIERKTYSKKQVTGKLSVITNNGDVCFTCFTLELPDLNNQKKISCIPAGKYKVTKRTSEKYGVHFHILNVLNRDMILIHHGNYHTDILGCVLVGATLADINGDNYKDVTSSKDTMKKLVQILPDKFDLEIKA